MADGRQYAAATLLPDGKVLVIGGFNNCDDDFCTDVRTAELYDPATGKWSRTGSMHAGREQFTATLLRGGQVLVAGGLNQGGFCCGQSTFSSAELYDPATGAWRVTASMAARHAGQTAALLHNGWVLVAGGGTSTAEIYEPQRAIWVSPGVMSTARTGAAAALLPSGHVLVTGGTGPDGQPQTSAEEFLAGPGPLVSFTPGAIAFGGQQVGSVSGAQSFKVTNFGSAGLTVGGTAVTGKNPGDFRLSTSCGGAPVPPGGSCTVSVRFTPTATGLRTARAAVSDDAPLSPQGPVVSGFGGGPNAWVPVGPMATPRDAFTATPLPDGEVLVAGGETSIGAPVATAELYNPATRSFSPTGPLHTARYNATATLLPDGKVLVVGGKGDNFANLASAELYNPATGTWARTRPAMAGGYAETSTLLPDGNVLVTGFGFGTVAAEVYHPATAAWTATGPLTATHFFASATLLQDGTVLLAGGGTAAAELYDPATNDWTATGSLNTARQGAVAALLHDGDVLVAGGVAPGGGNALTSAELYDPATGTWSSTGSLIAGRIGAAATLLPDGRVLVTGGCTAGCDSQPGLSSAEIYSPGQSGFFSQGPPMTQGRVFHAATLLASGDVLVAGGDARYGGTATSTAEVYTPALVSVHPSSGAPGAQVTVSGSGFYAGETVKLLWDSLTVLGHAKTSRTGTFSTKITIPGATAGAHQIGAQGRRSFAGASATFTVTG
jgi:N-acetylneuraminic acid mutarotase